MFYTEAPWFHPRSQAAQRKMNWIEVALKGRTAFEFDEQIRQVEGGLQEWWRTTTSERSGNPVYASPSVLIMYRADQARSLASLIPKEGDRDYEYDIVIAPSRFGGGKGPPTITSRRGSTSRRSPVAGYPQAGATARG